MEEEEKSLEGWVPEIGEKLTLTDVIEYAYDYRGNVTVDKKDGAPFVGYLFNRNGGGSEPFVQLFDEAGEGPFTLRYSEIANIRFTGKDTAAGKSYEAWKRRREAEKATKAAEMQEQGRN